MVNNWSKKYPPLCICWKKATPSKEVANFIYFLKKKGLIKGNVLDVGCGYGAESLYLARSGFKVIGIDINREAIGFDKRKVRNKSIKFIHGNILKMGKKLRPDSFDVIIDSSCLHTLRKPERKKYIKIVHALLKKNGWLFLFELSNSDEYCKLYCPKRKWAFRKISFGRGAKFYVHFFTKKDIVGLMKNFKIIKYRTVRGKSSKDLIPRGIKERKFHVFYAIKK